MWRGHGESEKSTNPKENPLPKLSHLRESGAIEQDADVVVFLHRNRDESKEDNAEGMKDGIKSMLIVEKNRNGRTGIVNLRFLMPSAERKTAECRKENGGFPASRWNVITTLRGGSVQKDISDAANGRGAMPFGAIIVSSR